MTLQIGEIVADKYRIVRLLGKGGMGEVYEGENLRIHRRVALKLLRSTVSQKPDVVQRFEREAQAAGRIGSDHIVEVLDLGDLPDGSRYMVMEFLEGATLSERIVSRGRISPREAAAVVAELCEGLGAAHNAGIIHRDLKPANIFLVAKPGRPELVKILDFGVSKFSVLGDDLSLTSTGGVVGTPYYMSPEQAKGAKGIDARSDLYSVGVILYEAITGHVPFNADTFNELIFKIALETPPPLETFVPNLDPRMAAIVRRAMAREAGARFQSAVELKQALETWIADLERGIPIHASSPVGGWAAPQPQAMPPRFGTQIMEAVPAAPIPPTKQNSSALPILIASGIFGFGVVAIAAALMFHKKPGAQSDAIETRTSAAANEKPMTIEHAAVTNAEPAPNSAIPTSIANDLPAAVPVLPSVSLTVASPTQPSAAPTPTFVAPPPIARTATPPPNTKPGGRTISGSLE